jgi:hypothetical protein
MNADRIMIKYCGIPHKKKNKDLRYCEIPVINKVDKLLSGDPIWLRFVTLLSIDCLRRNAI